MVCSRCGKDRYPLYSMPTPVSRVTHKIDDLEWVCKECLRGEKDVENR